MVGVRVSWRDIGGIEKGKAGLCDGFMCCVLHRMVQIFGLYHVFLWFFEKPFELGTVSWNAHDDLFACVKSARHGKGQDGTGWVRYGCQERCEGRHFERSHSIVEISNEETGGYGCVIPHTGGEGAGQ